MSVPSLSDRLHISGMDANAASLAKQYHCGYEITDFSYAPNLERPEAFSSALESLSGLKRLWLHGPFAELIPCAIDPNVRANALVRFRQTVVIAQQLGIRQLVFHGGFIPYVYYPEWYVAQSISFWREFLQTVPPDYTIVLENVMEPGPDMLIAIAEGVSDPRLGLCLDIGHANTIVSKTPPFDWLAPMFPHLRHVHLHDNHGDLDEHLPLGEGSIPLDPILLFLSAHPDITLTIENQNALRSLQYLQNHGWLNV